MLLVYTLTHRRDMHIAHTLYKQERINNYLLSKMNLNCFIWPSLLILNTLTYNYIILS